MHGNPWMAAATIAGFNFCAVSVFNVLYLRRSRNIAPRRGGPLVSVILPARNEESNLAECIDTLLVQSYDNFEIVVVDDNSEDSTGAIAAAYAAKDPRIKHVEGTPVPAGWNGKQFACHQGVANADGELFLMTDADVRHESDSIGFAVETIYRRNAKFLSGYVRQGIGSFGEALIVPMTYIMTSLLLPIPLLTSRFFPDWGFAIGQYMMIRRGALEAIGGYESLKDSLVEDIAMARAVKASGNKTVFVDARGAATCRMYNGYRSAFRGFAKSIFGAVGGRAWVIAMLSVFITVLVLLPAFNWFRGVATSGALLQESTVPVVLFLVMWTITLTDRRIKPLYAIFYPLGFLNIVFIGAVSMIRTGFGIGIEWKGRLVRCGRPDLPDPEILNAVALYRFASFLVYSIVFTIVVLYNEIVFGLRVRGRKNLRGLDSGFLLISNHSLILDPAVVAQSVFPRRTYFSALEETFERPFLGSFIRLLGAFPLPNESCIRRILPAVEWALNRGKCVHFFPEGELNRYNRDPAEFNEGVFFLADRFDVPVVPVTLVSHRRRILGKELPYPFIRITVVIGAPLTTNEFRTRTSHESRRASARIMAEEARKRMHEAIRSELA